MKKTKKNYELQYTLIGAKLDLDIIISSSIYLFVLHSLTNKCNRFLFYFGPWLYRSAKKIFNIKNIFPTFWNIFYFKVFTSNIIFTFLMIVVICCSHFSIFLSVRISVILFIFLFYYLSYVCLTICFPKCQLLRFDGQFVRVPYIFFSLSLIRSIYLFHFLFLNYRSLTRSLFFPILFVLTFSSRRI